MALRWKLLLVIATTIIVLDQWTKFLAVKHLTTGIQQAHSQATGQRGVALDAIGPAAQLGYFYGGVKHPCREPGARCPTIKLIDGRWHWNYAENPGAAWSFLANAGANIRVPFFLTVSTLAILLILWFYRKLESDQWMLMIALALVFGGAVGNFIDRARLTYVIDFIVWYIGSYRWPTFNVADSAISTGVGLLVLDSLLETVRKKKPEDEKSAQCAPSGNS